MAAKGRFGPRKKFWKECGAPQTAGEHDEMKTTCQEKPWVIEKYSVLVD